jgi:hypothetical protein
MTTIINAASMTPAGILQTIGNALKNHRQALEILEDYYQTFSAYAATDFQAAPINMSVADSTAVFNALADAHAEFVNYRIGLPAALPATGYKYGDSQKAVIGLA